MRRMARWFGGVTLPGSGAGRKTEAKGFGPERLVLLRQEPRREGSITLSTSSHLPTISAIGLRIGVTQRHRTTAIELAGDLDRVHEEAVRSSVVEALERRPERLVLDLSRLSFIDSSGVRV